MSSTAVFEHSYYVGNYISGILYGVELVMYAATLHCCRRLRPGELAPVLYSTALLVLLTIDIATNAFWGEQMWITARDTPGGPVAFIAQHLSVWYQILGSSAVVALIFLGDALLLYRCYILWGSDYKIIALPVLVYLAAFALALVELVGAFKPGGDFFDGRALLFGTTYYTLSIGLNILLTLLITGRLLHHSRRMRMTFGRDHGSARLYTGIASMIAESAAPYTLAGMMFLVPYASQSETASLFGQLYAKFACLSPQLIVLRVAQGRTWDRDTVRNAHGPGSNPRLTVSVTRTRTGGPMPFEGNSPPFTGPFAGTPLSEVPPSASSASTPHEVDTANLSYCEGGFARYDKYDQYHKDVQNGEYGIDDV